MRVISISLFDVFLVHGRNKGVVTQVKTYCFTVSCVQESKNKETKVWLASALSVDYSGAPVSRRVVEGSPILVKTREWLSSCKNL